eukprot:11167303-Lingulodinium_polyedra.AAC.1
MPARRCAAWLLSGGKGARSRLAKQLLCWLAWQTEVNDWVQTASQDVADGPPPKGPVKQTGVREDFKDL